VTCSATDAHHNTSTGSFAITVVDTTPPAMALPGDITVIASDAKGAAASFIATAADLVDGSVQATCTPASGSLFAVGTTTVACVAADRAGNKSSGTLRVTVGFTSPTTATPDGRILGAGFLDDSGAHHHFALRVSQTNGADAGRFEYWVNDGRRCRPDDDEGDADRRDHQGPMGRFEATGISDVTFSDDPAFKPGRDARGARPTVDTVRFSGTGKWNGKSGYTFEALATDRGEPGRHRDTFSLIVRDGRGTTVASVNGAIDGGNIQSTRLR
jgi:hypothetical protein